MFLPILYSRTEIGQVQSWQVEIEDNCFRTIEGIVGGALTTSKWTEVEGKSIGRSNETSPNEQALKEAEAKWKKKTEKKYFQNIKDIDNESYFEPMLAHKWLDYKDEIRYPVFVSPKLDGMRSISQKNSMSTRNGKPIVSCPHISEALKDIFIKFPDLVLDGELYNHSLKADFNKIISLCKKTKPTAADLAESKKIIEFHIFDVYLSEEFLKENKNINPGYMGRLNFLKDILKDCNPCLVLVDSQLVNSFEEVEKSLSGYLCDGYEGVMVRVTHSLYECKRSKYLLKYKLFVDEEFIIVDIEQGKGNRAGVFGRFILEMKDGKIFESSSRGNEEYYRELWINKEKYIGLYATCRYQNLTPDEKKPRFGVVISIRDYE